MHYLEKNSENTSAWEALGCAYFRKKRYERATECFEKALDLDPHHSSTLRNMGVLKGVMGFKQEGYEMVLRSYNLKPDDFRTTMFKSSRKRGQRD